MTYWTHERNHDGWGEMVDRIGYYSGVEGSERNYLALFLFVVTGLLAVTVVKRIAARMFEGVRRKLN